MTDDDTGLVEPDITINGIALSFAQAMTVRVAITGYAMLLDSVAMRDNLGALADNYVAHLSVVALMMTGGDR